MTPNPHDRTFELLIDRATEGLSQRAAHELEALLRELPEVDADALDLAAAAVELAYTMPEEPLPEPLRARVAARAAEHFGKPDAP